MPVQFGGVPLPGEVVVGLVNNMPDGALQATERQFMRLLGEAAAGQRLRVRFYALPGVPRGETASAYLAARYAPIEALDHDRPDALIVTGCEPFAASLRDEPYWEPLGRLVDWAERHTVSTLWSCLAAHAAVLHRDGIERHRRATKRLGVHDCAVRAAHPLLHGIGQGLRISHSRWNDLDEADLAAAGYTVLTAGESCGVNLFVKQGESLHVHFQGHPEYDPDSIGREFRRDVARYLRGERPDLPALPQTYFDDDTVAALEAFRVLARADRTGVSLRDLPRHLGLRPGLAETWGESVAPVFRNWLGLIAAGREARRPARRSVRVG